MGKPLNLIFDLDGTLVDSLPTIHFVANKIFESKRLQGFSQATVRSFVGKGAGNLVAQLLVHSGLEADGALHAELVADLILAYETAHDLTSVYPGSIAALQALSDAGHRLGICTNKPERPALAVLQHFGLDRFFSVVIGGDSLPQRKPDPAPLHVAISALGGGPTVFVGDSEVDAETAFAASVPFALFTCGYRKAAPEALNASIIFNDYANFVGLIADFSSRQG